MIVHFDADLRPNHVVHHASLAYHDMLRVQADRSFVHLAEDVPLHEIAIERAADGGFRAFHAPADGERRELAQAPLAEDEPLPPAADVKAVRAGLLQQADHWFGRQAELRFPLAAIHAAKARASYADIRAEAAERGIGPDQLLADIETRATESHAALLTLDAERRALKRSIADAPDRAALDALRARLT